MTLLPSSLALTNIQDGAPIVASDHRNNYSAIQNAFNTLLAALSGGTSGQVLSAIDSTDVQWQTGAWRTLQRYAGNPLVTVGSTTTETDLFGTPGSGYSLAGGVLGTGSAVQIMVIGDLLNSSGGNIGYTFQAYYGSSSVAADVVTLATSGNRRTFVATLHLTALGATNAQLMAGVISGPATSGFPLALPGSGSPTGLGQGVLATNSASSQNLRFTVTNGGSAATVVARSYVAEISART